MAKIGYITLPDYSKNQIVDLDWRNSVAKRITQAQVNKWNSSLQNSNSYDITAGSNNSNSINFITTSAIGDITTKNITIPLNLTNSTGKIVSLNNNNIIDKQYLPFWETVDSFELNKIMDFSEAAEPYDWTVFLDYGYTNLLVYGFIGEQSLYGIADLELIATQKENHKPFYINIGADLIVSVPEALEQNTIIKGKDTLGNVTYTSYGQILSSSLYYDAVNNKIVPKGYRNGQFYYQITTPDEEEELNNNNNNEEPNNQEPIENNNNNINEEEPVIYQVVDPDERPLFSYFNDSARENSRKAFISLKAKIF